MKRLSVKKNAECMACLDCVRACSTAFYKEFNGSCSELNEHLKNAAATVVQQRKKNLKIQLQQEARNGLG